MHRLWLVLLPVLFLPEFGLDQRTSMGVLKISDIFILPYVVSVFWAIRKSKTKRRLIIDDALHWIILFVAWVSIALMTVSLIDPGYTEHDLLFSTLKVAKLVLYGLAAILTIKAIAKDNVYRQFNWALLAAGLVTGTGLLIGRFFAAPVPISIYEKVEKTYQDNIVSAMMAILITYILALLLTGYGTKLWRRCTPPALIVMVLGTMLSEGRGGMIAAVMASLYLLLRLKKLKLLIEMALISGLIGIFAYNQFTLFRDQVDLTFNPDTSSYNKYQSEIAGVDTAGRLRYWLKEGAKYIDAPILGHGFFHRTGGTGLDPVGSHSFFLQMFLETGFVGGILVLLIFWKMWQLSNHRISRQFKAELPAKVAIMAAFIVALSGEYLYGGLVLFSLLITFGVVGRLPASIPDKMKGRHNSGVYHSERYKSSSNI